MSWIPKLFRTAQCLRSLVRNAFRAELSLPTLLSRSAGIAGFAAVFASVFTSWFSVPAAASFDAPILPESPLASWVYRLGSLGVSSAALVIFIRGSRWKWRLARLYLLWLIALLFFPYFVSVWSAEVAGRASWLQSQHQNLTAVTGDILISQEFKGSLLRHLVDVVTQPIETQVGWLPDWEPQNFGWSRMLEIVKWFGWSGWFTSFMRKGWPLALGGTVAILLALSREAGPATLRTAQKILLQGGAMFLTALLVALAPLFVGRSCLLAAKRCAQEGDYASAHRFMRWSARCMPAITQDGNYLMQAGLLADALGSHNAEATYYRARLAEDAGFHFQARSIYLEGLSAGYSQPALLREHVKGVIHHAASAMDTGEFDSATVLLEKVLRADPTNLKANYSLQLAYLRTGNSGGLCALRQRMKNVYAFFNTPLKNPVLANGTENLAVDELVHGDAAAALKMWIEAKTP